MTYDETSVINNINIQHFLQQVPHINNFPLQVLTAAMEDFAAQRKKAADFTRRIKNHNLESIVIYID